MKKENLYPDGISNRKRFSFHFATNDTPALKTVMIANSAMTHRTVAAKD